MVVHAGHGVFGKTNTMYTSCDVFIKYSVYSYVIIFYRKTLVFCRNNVSVWILSLKPSFCLYAIVQVSWYRSTDTAHRCDRLTRISPGASTRVCVRAPDRFRQCIRGKRKKRNPIITNQWISLPVLYSLLYLVI